MSRIAGSGWRRGGTPRCGSCAGPRRRWSGSDRGGGSARARRAAAARTCCYPVLPGPMGRCGGGDLADAAGPGGGLGVAADLRGGGSSGRRRCGAGCRGSPRTPSRSGSGSGGWNGMRAGGDMDRLAPAAGRVADAVAQIGAACAAVRRAAGPAVFEVSSAELVAACSGGGCWRRGRRRWRRCRSTRARVCNRSPRRVRVEAVTAVDHGKR